MTHIPSPAFWLGWAGVLPFAALSALTLMDSRATTGIEQGAILQALIAYGMIILSFMGGVQWGLEMTRGDGKSSDAIGFAASVVPALVAFGPPSSIRWRLSSSSPSASSCFLPMI